jgi:hypothetical protein
MSKKIQNAMEIAIIIMGIALGTVILWAMMFIIGVVG